MSENNSAPEAVAPAVVDSITQSTPPTTTSDQPSEPVTKEASNPEIKEVVIKEDKPAQPAEPEVPENAAAFWKKVIKKERELQRKEKELKPELEEFQKWKKVRELSKTDPLEYLKAGGLTYQQITEAVLSKGVPEPESEVKKINDTLQKLIDERENEKAAAAKQRLKEVEDNYRSHLSNIITKSDKYDLVRANGDYGLKTVFAVQELHYNNTGRILSDEEALDKVEGYFEKEAHQLLERSSKLKSLLKPSQESKKSQADQSDNKPKTLTNNLHTNQPAQTAKRELTYEESITEAAKLLRWT